MNFNEPYGDVRRVNSVKYIMQEDAGDKDVHLMRRRPVARIIMDSP